MLDYLFTEMDEKLLASNKYAVSYIFIQWEMFHVLNSMHIYFLKTV